MNSKRFLFGLVLSFLFIQTGFAQPAAEQAEQAPAPVQAEDATKRDPLREQIIYVPYEKLP